MTDTIGLPEVLEALNYTEAEFYQLCTQVPGEPFTSTVHAFEPFAWVPQDRNVWFSVNPTCGPARENAGRGGAADVTRLAGIWVDLDVKPAGCPTFEAAMEIIDDLAVALGTPPTVLIRSGHGLQPIWAIESGDIQTDANPWSDFVRTDAAALVRRWGKLVANVADRRGSKVDSLYDLPRILRVPDSINVKDPVNPVPATGTLPGGSPVDLERLAEVLEEYGIPRLAEDGTDPGVILSAPAEWTAAGHSCKYSAELVKGWATEQPSARHPWLVAQATRLAAMRRNGCLTDTDAVAAEQTLVGRFQQMVTGSGDRGATPGEIRGALAWGVETAATFTAEHLASELGNHLHTSDPGDFMPRTLTMAPPRHLTVVPPPPPLPRTAIPAPPGTIPPPPPPPVVQGATVTKLAPVQAVVDRLTDHANASLFVARHRDHLRYVPSRGAWFSWNGCRWAECEDDGEALQAVVETIQAIEPNDDAQRKHKTASLSRKALESAMAIGRRFDDMRVTSDQLDADPWALNTPNCIVDLRTGATRPTSPDEFHTLSTAAPYDPAATAPRFQRYLHQTFNGDQELIGYVQRLAGYSASGVVTQHVLPFLHGAGANGKTVLLDVLQGVLAGYASSTPPGFLLSGGRDDESAIARLKGLRLIVASEVNRNAKFDEAKVKMLTGGDRITARHLFQKHITFEPSHTIWLAGNHQPKVESGGESFWRRLRLVPFEHTVPVAQREPGLAATVIREEAAGVLAWLVQGAIQVVQGGLADPDRIRAATKIYADEEDALGRFVEDCCFVGGGEEVKLNTRHARAAYEMWCKEEGEQPLTPQMFGRELRTRCQVEVRKSNGERFYTNIALAVGRDRSGSDRDRSRDRYEPQNRDRSLTETQFELGKQ